MEQGSNSTINTNSNVVNQSLRPSTSLTSIVSAAAPVATTSSISTSILSGGGTESYYKNQADKLDKENKQLKAKLDTIERENRDLKKSLYELSFRYDQLSLQLSKPPKPFDINSLDGDNTETDNTPQQFVASKGTSVTERARSNTRKGDPRHLYCKQTFKGHTGAIYTILFSPCGRFLASGSFDKSVRIWDLSMQQEIQCLQEHQLNISDLSWSNDSSELLSGGYDQTVKVWDINKGKLISSHEAAGFVQSVTFNPADNNTFFAGSTQKKIFLFDRRQTENGMVFENDSMINSIYAYKDGLYVLSGDSHGCLKIWDTRKGACVFSQSIDGESKNKPISYLNVSKGVRSDSEGKYLGVNCYDNVLRVYDRGSSSLISSQPPSRLELLHSLTGHKNKNWPITSSFFIGKNYQISGNTNVNTKTTEKEDNPPEEEISDLNNSFLIATGSADSYAYVFSISGQKGGSSLIQKLEGHSDRVYSVNFHPFDPILSTCSADGTIKLWSN